MSEIKWISILDRVPTEADTDRMNCVICYHIYQGVMTTGLHNILNNRFVSHWMPCPEPPFDEVKKTRDEWEKRLEKKYRLK